MASRRGSAHHFLLDSRTLGRTSHWMCSDLGGQQVQHRVNECNIGSTSATWDQHLQLATENINGMANNFFNILKAVRSLSLVEIELVKSAAAPAIQYWAQPVLSEPFS